MNKVNFCDFCECDLCKNGATYLDHAQIRDGRWICGTCWEYKVCLEACGTVCEGDCIHRPIIVGEWIEGV